MACIETTRAIGYRRGTGGSCGVGFLNLAQELAFFPELFEVRTTISVMLEVACSMLHRSKRFMFDARVIAGDARASRAASATHAGCIQGENA